MLNEVDLQDCDLSVASADACSCSLPSSAGYRPEPAAGGRADGSVASSLTISETCGVAAARLVPAEISIQSAPLSADRQSNRMTRTVVSAPATIRCAGSPEAGETGKTNGTDPASFSPSQVHHLSRHKLTKSQGLPYLIFTLLLAVLALSAALHSSYSENQWLRSKLNLQNTTSFASSHLSWSELRRLSAELSASESENLGLSMQLSATKPEMERLKAKADLCTPFAEAYGRAKEGAETTVSVVHDAVRSLYTGLHTALGGSCQQDVDKKKVYGAMVILSFISAFVSSGDLSGLSESSE